MSSSRTFRKIADLKVTARTSTQRYAVRLMEQLIHATTDAHFWAETSDRKPNRHL
ncbi:hypothetical protein BH20VER1_BH20VER1_17910 [soil metagenome]